VREVPVLLVPPMINKYYVMDLAPGRSQIEHLVQTGQEVSRSPGATRARSSAAGAWTRTPTR
jgi:poly(3-hydroxyalkanoate) synthetase